MQLATGRGSPEGRVDGHVAILKAARLTLEACRTMALLGRADPTQFNAMPGYGALANFLVALWWTIPEASPLAAAWWTGRACAARGRAERAHGGRAVPAPCWATRGRGATGRPTSSPQKANASAGAPRVLICPKSAQVC